MVSSWRTLLIPSSSVAIFVISQDAFQGEVDFRLVGFKYYPTLQSFTTSASHATHKRTVIIPSTGGREVLGFQLSWYLVRLLDCGLICNKVLNWDTGPPGSHDIVSKEGVTEKTIITWDYEEQNRSYEYEWMKIISMRDFTLTVLGKEARGRSE